MHNLMMRFKIHKALKTINKYWLAQIDLKTVLSDIDESTLSAIEQYECIRIDKTWGGHIIEIYPGPKSQIYSINRSELWFNRICSYIFGIISGVMISYIIDLLSI